MSKTETDKKLELIRNIRMQNQYNRQTLHRREGILYGDLISSGGQGEIYGLEEAALPSKTGKFTTELPVTDNVFVKENGNTLFKGFRVRLVMAMILFLGFVYLDVKQVTLKGVTTEQILSFLQEDALYEIIDFSKAFQMPK